MRRLALHLLLACLARGAVAQSEGSHVPGEVLVRFRADAGSARDVAIAGLHATVVGEIPSIGGTRLRLPDPVSTDRGIFQLSPLPFVEFVEPNFVAEATHIPNDPLYSSEWGPPKIQCESAWDVSRGAASTVIAIVDTGIDNHHSDLASKLVAGYDFVN